ncbi:hypothetical protein CS369_11860 [Candidatus Symbiopectobacterium sp. 'North America']|nr:hypothetical protein [Candidatus Symbiopectobacterium sp. 'North America']
MGTTGQIDSRGRPFTRQSNPICIEAFYPFAVEFIHLLCIFMPHLSSDKRGVWLLQKVTCIDQYGAYGTDYSDECQIVLLISSIIVQSM